jgi:hypothetical protein
MHDPAALLAPMDPLWWLSLTMVDCNQHLQQPRVFWRSWIELMIRDQVFVRIYYVQYAVFVHMLYVSASLLFRTILVPLASLATFGLTYFQRVLLLSLTTHLFGFDTCPAEPSHNTCTTDFSSLGPLFLPLNVFLLADIISSK